jgi:hypothetical protein
MNSKYMIVALGSVVFSCAADPGTRPHDMSSHQHEEAAKGEEMVAASHEGGAEGAPAAESAPCGRGRPCWTTTSSATKEHKDEAARHRELAAKHRAASSALAQAEASACADVPDEDRDVSPFHHREDIQNVSVLEEEVRAGKGVTKKTIGARVVFRALPGMTAEWLQRVVNCHLARNASVAFEMPEMEYCPLAVKGASATVRSTGDGFAVEIKGDDARAVEQIIQRANALRPPGG